MPKSQTTNGKAFEYACALSMYEHLELKINVTIEESPQLTLARGCYLGLLIEEQRKMRRAADAAVRVLVNLEPQLEHPTDEKPLKIHIQTDSHGISGDVRDVLCVTIHNNWEIGISCKHNHKAVKHSRLSDTIDFGESWLGIPCSKEYFKDVGIVFSRLRLLKDTAQHDGTEYKWSQIEGKQTTIYQPVLNAFMNELRRIDSSNDNVPSLLIHYLLGKIDFYKIIMNGSKQTTTIQAFNFDRTLNKSAGKYRSSVNVPIVKLPATFYSIGFKPNSKSTIIVACDEGWSISMRLHNASTKVEPSLKFDVQLLSIPTSIHSQVEPW